MYPKAGIIARVRRQLQLPNVIPVLEQWTAQVPTKDPFHQVLQAGRVVSESVLRRGRAALEAAASIDIVPTTSHGFGSIIAFVLKR